MLVFVSKQLFLVVCWSETLAEHLTLVLLGLYLYGSTHVLKKMSLKIVIINILILPARR